MEQRYVVALGSNRRHHRFGPPVRVLKAALRELERQFRIKRAAPTIETPPLGHTRRRYANSAVLLSTTLMPEDLLDALQAIERQFGRRHRGRPWGDRVLDLDILLWSGGAWASPGLVIPHVALRTRAFALGPAAAAAPDWRDPLTGLTMRKLHARLTRAGRLPIRHSRSGP